VRRADVLLERVRHPPRLRDLTRAIALYRDAIEVYRGSTDPTRCRRRSRHNIGELQRWAGQLPEALEAFREAARINRDRLGNSPRLASNLVGVACRRRRRATSRRWR
jgi:tetratricopeptide (TPR) repeat protein